MKKIYTVVIALVVSYTSYAQIDLGTFLEGGTETGNELMQQYLEPAFVGFGYALNSGWYNTAKPHKIAGFDLTIMGSFAHVPTSAQTFDPSVIPNVLVEPAENGQTLAPTLLGENLDASDIPYLVFNADTEDEISVTSPTGLGIEEVIPFNAVPAPIIQLGVGLIKNTEVKLRLVPEQTFGDEGQEFSTKLFGIGVLHDIKQWIPGISNLPFDLSGFVGFTKMNTSYSLDADNPDQLASFNVSGTTVQALISKKLAVLTVYGGVGFASTSTDFTLDGTYETEVGTFVDPIALEYSTGGLRAKVGARLKLLILTLHAEYALQEYNTFNTGVGISIR